MLYSIPHGSLEKEFINVQVSQLMDIANNVSNTSNVIISENSVCNDNDKTSKRSQNGSIEAKRLVWLVNKFNTLLSQQNPEFILMLFNVNIDVNSILTFEVAGGACRHYDIIIRFKDGTTQTIEHKAVKTQKNDMECPWSLTPQLFNATYNFTTLSQEYCYLWHTSFMPILKQEYPELPDVPSYEDFLKGDANMGSAKTEFGKALKAIKNENETNHKFITQITKQSIRYFYKYIVKNRPEIIEQLRQDCETSMQEVLQQKNLWINAYYPTTSTIETDTYFLTVTPQLSNLDVELVENNNTTKIKLHYNLSSNPNRRFHGEALLRWGNGNGIANIRWNIS